LSFLYTTGEYLLKARTLNDLVVRSDERALLWQSLHERAQNEQIYKTGIPEVELPLDILMVLLGIKELQEPHDAKAQENGNLD
jgi:hypothetical protein